MNLQLLTNMVILCLLVVRAIAEDEEFCSGYTGKSFGLCNAFCQAQSCHLGEDRGNSCEKLKEKFQEASGETFLPCEAQPSSSPSAWPSASPTSPPTSSEPCPCWTEDYVASVADFFATNGLQMRFWTSPDLLPQSSVGSFQDFLDYGTQLVVGGNQFAVTGYFCADREQDEYNYELLFKDYKICVDDILEIDSLFAPLGGLCQLQATPEDSCPCWEDEIPDLEVYYDSFSVSPGSFLKRGSVSLQELNYLTYFAEAKVDGTMSCGVTDFTGSSPTTTSETVTGDQFNKCYNDLLEKSYQQGANECALEAFS